MMGARFRATKRSGKNALDQRANANWYAHRQAKDDVRTPLTSETLTVSTVSVAFQDVPYNADYAVIYVWDNPISYRVDGQAATANSGEGIEAAADSGPYIIENRAKIENFRAIRTGGADAVLHIQYYKQ